MLHYSCNVYHTKFKKKTIHLYVRMYKTFRKYAMPGNCFTASEKVVFTLGVLSFYVSYYKAKNHCLNIF